jgi:hypothetical protein
MQCSALTAAAVLLVTAAPASAVIRIPSLTRYGPPLHLNEAERFSLGVPRRTTLEADLGAAQPSLSSRFEQEQALSPSTQTNEQVREALETLKSVAEEAFKETGVDLAGWAGDEASDEPPDFDEVMYDNAWQSARTAFPYANEDAIALAAEYVTAQADEVAQNAFDEAAPEPSPYEPTIDGVSSASNDNSALTAIAAGGGALVVGVLLVAYFARRRSS